MSAVYKAQDTRLHRPVAVKMMSPVPGVDLQQLTQMFQAEAQRLASLKHPSIPDIYDHFQEAGDWFLAMEFIEGETLSDYLQRRGGRLPVDEVLEIGLQLADVLHYLHQRQPPMIFRDLKPANVMIASNGQVFLIDFGIARHFKTGKNDTHVFVSRGYAAPEQYTAQTTVRSDIYSLGATLHHLLTGHHPALNTPSDFDFAPLQSFDPSLPVALNTLIMQMVEKEAKDRSTSVTVVKEELQRIIAPQIPRGAWGRDILAVVLAAVRYLVIAGSEIASYKPRWRDLLVLLTAVPYLIIVWFATDSLSSPFGIVAVIVLWILPIVMGILAVFFSGRKGFDGLVPAFSSGFAGGCVYVIIASALLGAVPIEYVLLDLVIYASLSLLGATIYVVSIKKLSRLLTGLMTAVQRLVIRRENPDIVDEQRHPRGGG